MAGPRHPQREMASKEKVSITLDRDVFDFIEHGIRMRWWPSRSAGINMCIAQVMRQHVQSNQGGQQRLRNRLCNKGMPPMNPHSTQKDGWDVHNDIRKHSKVLETPPMSSTTTYSSVAVSIVKT